MRVIKIILFLISGDLRLIVSMMTMMMTLGWRPCEEADNENDDDDTDDND